MGRRFRLRSNGTRKRWWGHTDDGCASSQVLIAAAGARARNAFINVIAFLMLTARQISKACISDNFGVLLMPLQPPANAFKHNYNWSTHEQTQNRINSRNAAADTYTIRQGGNCDG